MTTVMKYRGLLFAPQMAREVWDGTKTQTRRAVKAPKWPAVDGHGKRVGSMLVDLAKATSDHGFPTDDAGELLPMALWPAARPEQYRNHYLKVPFAHPFDGWDDDGKDARQRFGAPIESGSIVYVKEKFRVHGDCGRDRASTSTCTGPKDCEFAADFDGEQLDIREWRSSLHMPRWAARSWLRITAVRVERVRDISEDDAIAEGFDPGRVIGNTSRGAEARRRFLEYAGNLNMKRLGCSFEEWLNTWVWVYSFERVERPEGIA